MYNIVLSEIDRKVLLSINKDENGGIDEERCPISDDELDTTLRHLAALELIETKMFRDKISSVRLSAFGKKFLLENPTAKSETDDETKWRIERTLSIIAIAISVVALAVSFFR